MSTTNPFLIEPLEQIDPIQNKKWVPDDEMWFLPRIFDLPNNTFGGYWYCTERYFEKPHVHLGVVNGIVFRGEMIFSYEDKHYSFKENQSFILPPLLLNTSELIPGKNGFLFFAVFVGQANNAIGEKFFDAESYYEATKKYYTQHNISMNSIIIIP